MVIIRPEHRANMRRVSANLLVMLLGPGEEDAGAEEREGPALEGPAGQAVAAPLHHLPEVVGCCHVLKQASCKETQARGALPTDDARESTDRRDSRGHLLRKHQLSPGKHDSSRIAINETHPKVLVLPFHLTISGSNYVPFI